jgi:hypothetical protein
MSTTRPFAYNPGSPISGTIQVGDLSIGTPTSGFTNSPQYWNGPDEELGYVIARPVSGNTQPSPVFNSAPGSPMTWSSVYKATDISLSNVNQTATEVFSYSESVLSDTLINGNDKVMFSIYFNSTQPSVGIGGRFESMPQNCPKRSILLLEERCALTARMMPDVLFSAIFFKPNRCR